MAKRGWLASEIARMIEMRDMQHMKWIDIARAFGRCGPFRDGPASCCATYTYWKAKFAREAKMRAAGINPPPRRIPANYDPPIEAPASVARSLAAPVKRPRYFHSDDMDIMGRIERQGLSAGMFGDPIPGRSALDRRGQ